MQVPVIGLVIALSSDARFILGPMTWRTFEGRRTEYRMLAGDTGLHVVCSGPGLLNAQAAARWLIVSGADALAVMGVCGGLQGGLRSGDLIVAEAVGERHRTGMRFWPTDAIFAGYVRAGLAAGGAPVHLGRIFSSGQPVLTTEAKWGLHRETGALAVDMESGAVARAACRSGLPFFSLRAVCDPAEVAVPRALYACLTTEGKVRPLGLLTNLLRTPALARHLLSAGTAYWGALSALKASWQGRVRDGLGLLVRGGPSLKR
ncbi:MAG: hypothetical protein MUP74_02870 [Desulfobacterales bacterium]|nr:hypothetical protein [Desulfobacterales bacterium]